VTRTQPLFLAGEKRRPGGLTRLYQASGGCFRCFSLHRPFLERFAYPSVVGCCFRCFSLHRPFFRRFAYPSTSAIAGPSVSRATMEVASENSGSSQQGCCAFSDEGARVAWSWVTTHGCLRILALAIDLRHATDGDGWSEAASPVAWVRCWIPAE
jgi:hypothetical protein